MAGVCLYWFCSSIVAPVEESWSDVPELLEVSVQGRRTLRIEGDRCADGRVEISVSARGGVGTAATSAHPRPDGTWTAQLTLDPTVSGVLAVYATCVGPRVARDYSAGTVELP